MANKVFTSFNDVKVSVKNASNELNGIFRNPFVVCNLLNKAAKGDFSKVAGVLGVSCEDFKKVAKAVKSMHKYSTPFAYDFLFDAGICRKDGKGRLCSVSKAKIMPNWGVDIVDINTKGFTFLRPVPCTINGIYNAFAKALKNDVREIEKSEKKAAKLEESRELKAAKSRLNNAIRDFNDGRISEIEFCERVKAAKIDIAKYSPKAA